MTTNPPPLTAEDEFLIDMAHKYTMKPTSVVKIGLKTYAAQQTAELVADFKIMQDKCSGLCVEINNLRAEHERLKQAAALFREASFQAHSSHWDSQGTNGANCPACFRASSLRQQADDLLTQPPKEAT